MNRSQAIAKLERIVSADLPALARNVVGRRGRGYELFGNYDLSPQSGRWQAVKHRRDAREFGSLPSAVAWCIADKYQQHNLALRILRLDQQVTMLGQDITVRSAMRDRMRQQGNRDTVDFKLMGRRQRLAGLAQELDKSINQAKYWQIRGFNDETARTGRPASNR